MMQPLQDKLLIRLHESINNAAGLYIPPDASKFRTNGQAILGENRGTVVRKGPGRRHPKSGQLMPIELSLGDVVRFSELEYPEERVNGERYVLISEQDVLGVEEDA